MEQTDGSVESALEMSEDSVYQEGQAVENAHAVTDSVQRTTPRGRNSARTQADILRAASDLFSRRGYAYVTLKDIALHVGVTPALIVYYFESKRKLFDAVARIPATISMRIHTLNAKTIARDLLTYWREDDSRFVALALLRSLDVDGGELLRQEIESRIFGPWSAALRGEDSELRARLLGGVLFGYGLFSTGALLEPEAPHSSVDDERVLVYLERIIDACIIPASHGNAPKNS